MAIAICWISFFLVSNDVFSMENVRTFDTSVIEIMLKKSVWYKHHRAVNTEETFLSDFLVILKRTLQNY